MGANERSDGSQYRPWQKKTWVKVVGAVVAVLLLGGLGVFEYVLHNAGPLVRKRVVDTLSAYFHAPVELGSFDISLMHGIRVEGKGLRVPYDAVKSADGAEQGGASKTLVSVETFSFRTTISGLLHVPTKVDLVRVDGVEFHLPPGPERGEVLSLSEWDKQHKKSKIKFFADEVLATNVMLVIETDKPGKSPLTFNIGRLDVHHLSPDEPMTYEAQLVNPKPRGDIHAVGHFGPWKADNPRESAVDGTYTFTDVDLSTIKGLSGTLSSTGKFEGVMDRITVDGTTDVPDFALDISNHPMPLTTKFHAYVDATNGDTTLDPVKGMLRDSEILASGKVENVKGQGHDISLDAVLPHARMEDVLELGVKTNPPLMRGALAMKVHLHIPPGKERVSQKLELSGGTMKIQNVVFQRPKWQDKIDGLSMRAQGKPEDANDASTDKVAEVKSQMSLNFRLEKGSIYVDNLEYEMPGAKVMMNGVYSMDGKVFEFKGHVRTDATASQMVTGWKSFLLKPLDHFLKKKNAGMELPIAVSGVDNDVSLGLAMDGSAGDSSRKIAAGMKNKLPAAKGKVAK